MKSYKCAISGGVEGLDFFDLYKIVDNNRVTIRLQKDEVLPIELIPAEVLQNSLTNGCLGRSIKAGWVQVIGEGEEVKIPVRVVEPVIIPDPVETAEMLKRNSLIQTTVVEAGSFVADTSPKVEVKPKNSYADFLLLKHAQKLSFISKCDDVDLLNEINKKSDSKQLKNNTTLRLKKIK